MPDVQMRHFEIDNTTNLHQTRTRLSLHQSDNTTDFNNNNTVTIFEVQDLLQKEKDWHLLISSAASSTGLNAFEYLIGDFAFFAAFLANWKNTTSVSQVLLVTIVNFKSRAGPVSFA